MSNTIKWILDLDVKKFSTSLQGAAKDLEGLGDKGGISNLVDSFQNLGRAAAGFAAVKVVQVLGESALQASLLAEEIRVVNNQFDMLATEAGLNAKQLAADLASVSDGLVDDEDLLKASSQAIVAMGSNAAKLPEIFELSRKAASAFGGEAIDKFEQINAAIQSGQTRSLKQIGINIDAEATYKAYAKSIGVAVEQLTEEGKQYALMNQVLKTGGDKFKNVDENASELKNNVQRLTVAFGDLKEGVAILFDKVMGPAVKGLVEFTAEAVSGLGLLIRKVMGEDILPAATETAVKIGELKELIAELEAKKARPDRFISPGELQRLTKAKEELKALEGQWRSQMAAEDEASKKKDVEPDKASHVKAADPQAKLAAEKAYMSEVNKLKQEEVQMRIAAATTYDQWKEAKDAEKIAKEAEFQAQRKIKDQELAANNLISKQEGDALLEQMDLAHKARMDAMEVQFTDEKKRKLEEFDKKAYESQNSFAAGWKQAGAQATKDLDNWSKRGSVAATAVSNRLGAAFMAMGEGSQGAAEAMKGFMFAALADIAEAEGRSFMLAGLKPGAQHLLGAGAGLMALAGVLRSQARGSSSSFGGADSGGPGTPGFGGTIVSPADSTRPEAEQAPRKSVTLQVMGNIYETEDTKTRLVQLIRDATDATDFKYQQIGVG
jgi:hypothetical protein